MRIKEFGPQMRTMLKQWRARAKDEIPEQDLEKAYTMGFEQGEQGNYTPAKDREFMRWMKNDYPNKMTLLMSIWKEGNDISYSKFLMDSLPEEQEVKGMRKELVVEIQEEVSIPQDNKIVILEKGDKIRVLEDEKFNYMMLDRLRQDCIYAINQSKSTKQLWGKTVDGHIAEMRKLYNMVKEKPEWLTPEDIDMYEKELKKLEKAGK